MWPFRNAVILEHMLLHNSYKIVANAVILFVDGQDKPFQH
jgi:hypothetical protein